MKGKEELTIEQLFEKQNPQDGSCPKWAKNLAIEFAKLQVATAQRWIPVKDANLKEGDKIIIWNPFFNKPDCRIWQDAWNKQDWSGFFCMPFPLPPTPIPS